MTVTVPVAVSVSVVVAVSVSVVVVVVVVVVVSVRLPDDPEIPDRLRRSYSRVLTVARRRCGGGRRL